MTEFSVKGTPFWDSHMKGFSRRNLLKYLASFGITVISIPVVRRANAAEDHPMLFTWAGYDLPELHQAYIDKYGRSPDTTNFGDLDEAFAKHQAGFVADITTPGSNTLKRWRDAGFLAPIDTSRLSNWPDIYEGLKSQAPAFEDGKQWAVPFSWGSSSVVYRTDLAPEYIDNPTWEILWDKKFEGRLSVRDDANGSTVMAAIVAGIADPFNMSDADIAAVRARLTEQRPLLRYYWTDATTLEQSMAAGEIVAAYSWASSYAALAGQGIPVDYMVPKEGMIVWIDYLSFGADGTASDEAKYDLVDAMLSPESGAFLLNEFNIASPNRKAYELVDPEMVEKLGLADADAVADAGVLLLPFSVESQQKIVNMFNEVRSGF